MRLDQALARMFPEHSRSRLQEWVREGRVEVDGAPTDVRRRLWGGEHIRIRPEPASSDRGHAAQAIALNVIFEDEALLVVDKPAGLVVHPGSGIADGTLLNALLHHWSGAAALPRAGIVHRLDKDTSGLLVVAKTLESQTHLVRQMQARTVRRSYLALVLGRLVGTGVVDAPIGRHPVHRTRMAVVAGGREARTRWRALEELPGATLTECSLETGRTHQIRVHMASLGHPLVGDSTYAGRRIGAHRFGRQALHAFRLALVHPGSGTEMEWEAALPADFAALLDDLRGGVAG